MLALLTNLWRNRFVKYDEIKTFPYLRLKLDAGYNIYSYNIVCDGRRVDNQSYPCIDSLYFIGNNGYNDYKTYKRFLYVGGDSYNFTNKLL